MQITNVNIKDIKPYENNPRFNDNAVDYVANSIKEFGFKVPVVLDKNNVIITGHTRVKACEKLGIKEIPCIYADDLTEEQVKAFRLADNKVGEIADWDLDLLNNELDDIELDMSEFGFFEEIEEELEKEEEDKPKVKFTEVFNEENNYIILQFKTDIDWLQAQSLFDINPKMAYSTRKDGEIGERMKRVGIGRVLDGAEVIKKLLGDNL